MPELDDVRITVYLETRDRSDTAPEGPGWYVDVRRSEGRDVVVSRRRVSPEAAAGIAAALDGALGEEGRVARAVSRANLDAGKRFERAAEVARVAAERAERAAERAREFATLSTPVGPTSSTPDGEDADDASASAWAVASDGTTEHVDEPTPDRPSRPGRTGPESPLEEGLGALTDFLSEVRSTARRSAVELLEEVERTDDVPRNVAEAVRQLRWRLGGR